MESIVVLILGLVVFTIIITPSVMISSLPVSRTTQDALGSCYRLRSGSNYPEPIACPAELK